MEQGYSPGHPWYYIQDGRILEPDQIQQRTHNLEEIKIWVLDEVGRSPSTQIKRLEKFIKTTEQRLLERLERYEQIRNTDPESFVEALNSDSKQERMLSWATAMSLVHNHISYYKTQLMIARKLKEKWAPLGDQQSLF